MSRALLRPAAALALGLLTAGVVAACDGATTGDAPSGSTPPEFDATEATPVLSSDQTAVASTNPSARQDVGPDPAALDATCLDHTPVITQAIGSVNTIVVPKNAADFEVVVDPTPAVACPGDMVDYEVTVRNTTDVTSTFAPNRGLLFASGGMANWSLAALGPVDIAPGASWSTVVTAPIPAVAPGVYAVRPEGIAASGSVTVLEPASAAD